MKTFILICALAAIASADHHFTKKTPAEIKAAREECWNESNLSDDLRESVKKYEYPDNTAIHQTIKCIGTKLGTWSEHEGYHKSDLVIQFGEDSAPIFEKCITKKSDDDTAEKWAWHDWKCFIDGGLKEHVKKLE